MPDVSGTVSRGRHPSSRSSWSGSFAHPSERVFASLLDLYGVEWRYEPYEFPLAWDEEGRVVRGFRPDFYLPQQRLFIELTVLAQPLVTKKNRKIREFRRLYPELELRVVYRRDFEEIVRRHHVENRIEAA